MTAKKALPKIINMKFPADDIYWSEVRQFVQEKQNSEQNVLATTEFCVEMDNCYPYEWIYWREPHEFAWVILHKGMFERLTEDALEFFRENYVLVFENPVFIIYSQEHYSIQKSSAFNPRNILHKGIFLLKSFVKRFLKKSVDKSKKNILLVTANNSGNLGDDVITLAAQDLLQRQYPNAHIIIDKSPAEKSVVKNVDLVVLGGGGIFYDTCFFNTTNYCQYLLYASEFDIPCCAIGVGVARMQSAYGLEIYAQAINKAEFIFVRDQYSRDMLIDQIQVNTHAEVKVDTAFALEAEPTSIEINKTGKPTAFVSLVDTGGMLNPKVTQEYQSAMGETIEILMEHFKVVFIVQSRDDSEIHLKYSQKYNLEVIEIPFSDARSAISVYEQADVVITGRLHGFILSQIARVPCIPVSSKINKMALLIKDFMPSMFDKIVNIKDYDVSDLKEKIGLFFDNPNDFLTTDEEINECKKRAAEMESDLRKRIGRL